MVYVFDFGGVVFNWRPAELLQRVLPHRATDEDSTRHWLAQFFQGYGGDWAEFDRGQLEADEVALRIAARTGLSVDEVRRVVEGVPGELQLLPDTAALIQRLRGAGQRLFFLSNMPAPYARHLRETHPLHEWFEAGVFSGEDRHIKPDPAIFALAQQRFGVPAQELMFFDDHPANITAARAAGWQALQFFDAAQAEAALRAAGHWPVGA